MQLEQWRPEIEARKLVVFILDECHLLWGDLCGYIWGKTNERIVVPIISQRERQTYFGALNYGSKEFLVKPYNTGNSENMIAFLEYLQQQCPDQRLAVIWDGASYHRSQEIQAYLESLNQGKDPDQWQITCIRFAERVCGQMLCPQISHPNAPEQNPVEDIWLQAKRWIRGCFSGGSFPQK